MPIKWTYKMFINSQFKIQANCNDHKKFRKDLLNKSTSKLNLKIYFFAIFLVRTWFLRSMGAAPQNWLIPQKYHKNQNCRVSKSKIIMWHWFLALKARKAGNRPRTFFTGLTVYFSTKNNLNKNFSWLSKDQWNIALSGLCWRAQSSISGCWTSYHSEPRKRFWCQDHNRHKGLCWRQIVGSVWPAENMKIQSIYKVKTFQMKFLPSRSKKLDCLAGRGKGIHQWTHR